MSDLLLSILIPTVTGREDSYWRLYNELEKQSSGYPIEILQCKDNKEMPLGVKRQKLYQEAKGFYSVQWDDDDWIADDGIDQIMNAVFSRLIVDYLGGVYYVNNCPDCITYSEKCVINGQYFSSNHSLKYDDWGDNIDGYNYVRTPFYKDVIKTSIAKSVPFEPIRYAEDHSWARALKHHLKSEYHIDKEIYHYIHNSKPEEHNERYGIR